MSGDEYLARVVQTPVYPHCQLGGLNPDVAACEIFRESYDRPRGT